MYTHIKACEIALQKIARRAPYAYIFSKTQILPENPTKPVLALWMRTSEHAKLPSKKQPVELQMLLYKHLEQDTLQANFADKSADQLIH